MMDHTNFQIFHTVSNVLNNRQAHDEHTEFDFLDLVIKLLNGGLLEYFLDCFLLPLFCSQLLLLFGFGLPLFQSPLYAFANLRSYFLVAVVNYLNKQALALLDCRIMIQHDFEHIADNSLMIDCQVYFETVELLELCLVLEYDRQHPLLPYRGHQQIDNKQLVFIMHNHLL